MIHIICECDDIILYESVILSMMRLPHDLTVCGRRACAMLPPRCMPSTRRTIQTTAALRSWGVDLAKGPIAEAAATRRGKVGKRAVLPLEGRVLTEIRLCHACSCHEVVSVKTAPCDRGKASKGRRAAGGGSGLALTLNSSSGGGSAAVGSVAAPTLREVRERQKDRMQKRGRSRGKVCSCLRWWRGGIRRDPACAA